jgi:hypothetical protein
VLLVWLLKLQIRQTYVLICFDIMLHHLQVRHLHAVTSTYNVTSHCVPKLLLTWKGNMYMPSVCVCVCVCVCACVCVCVCVCLALAIQRENRKSHIIFLSVACLTV